jgi:hypothetical protein
MMSFLKSASLFTSLFILSSCGMTLTGSTESESENASANTSNNNGILGSANVTSCIQVTGENVLKPSGISAFGANVIFAQIHVDEATVDSKVANATAQPFGPSPSTATTKTLIESGNKWYRYGDVGLISGASPYTHVFRQFARADGVAPSNQSKPLYFSSLVQKSEISGSKYIECQTTKYSRMSLELPNVGYIESSFDNASNRGVITATLSQKTTNGVANYSSRWISARTDMPPSMAIHAGKTFLVHICKGDSTARCTPNDFDFVSSTSAVANNQVEGATTNNYSFVINN